MPVFRPPEPPDTGKERQIMVNKVRVTIAGVQYAIATTDSEKYIAQLADKLDKDIGKLMEKNPSLPMARAAVFWSKNPAPMLPRLGELADYMYYFQFTVTPYDRALEKGLPQKESVIETFRRLSDRIGPKRVIWRYDPILFTEKYTPQYHLRAFAQIAEALRGYTEKCVISFVDMYAKMRKNMAAIGMQELSETELKEFAKALSSAASENKISVASCAEHMELCDCGIGHSACIDRELIEELAGCPIKVQKDKNQRTECGCVESMDIGSYDTCANGCIYCYANHSQERVLKNISRYDADSPLLCSKVREEDVITMRKAVSLREEQQRFA